MISGHIGPLQIGDASRTSARLIDQISQGGVKNPRVATLPPLLGTGDTVNVALVATNKTVEIAPGIKFNGWTFNGTIPAPFIHVRQGQTINVTLTNKADMKHSIDFHAAQVGPNIDFTDVQPGETKEFSFKANVPGAFIYHCGTAPVLQHIANGMYGVIVVDPKIPLPPADISYVIEQGEYYTMSAPSGTYDGDYTKMKARIPDLVTFNGAAFQYKDDPLPVKVGKRVRIYFVNAGPEQWSSFHVIGGIFDKVYPSGDAKDVLTDVSDYGVPSGAGAIFDIIFPKAGDYVFVDHNMANMELGAAGVLAAK